MVSLTIIVKIWYTLISYIVGYFYGYSSAGYTNNEKAAPLREQPFSGNAYRHGFQDQMPELRPGGNGAARQGRKKYKTH